MSLLLFFFLCPIKCILLTAWIIRNSVLIVVDLNQLVNTEKKADTKIHVSPQFLPLIISQHCMVHMALLSLQHGNKSVTVSGYQLGFSLLHYDHKKGNQNSPRYTFNTLHIHMNFGCLCEGHVGGVWS